LHVASLGRSQFGEILRRFLLEVGEAILAAELNLLAFVDEGVGLALC